MEVPLPPGDMGGRGPGTARGHGRKGARGCTGTRGEGARGHGDTAEGARDFSSEAQGQPEQRAPTPSESAHKVDDTALQYSCLENHMDGGVW